MILLVAYFFLIFISYALFGFYGIIGQQIFVNTATLFILLYAFFISHLTITAMSLSFHRFHTHRGIIINKALDTFFQIWLWLVTSMSKADWVSVHIYHHAHSDRPKDPHSPVQKGLWRIMLGGAFDYNKAKNSLEVIKFRAAIKMNRLEKFIDNNQLLGPGFLVILSCLFFGAFWGSIISVINILVSPVLAVGGVNAIAHYFGYRNHHAGDNSRNIGFIFPLNFIMCGELDHNNHHKYPKSCSFRHKWYEFDIGYFYIKFLSKFKLIEIKNVYDVEKFKFELSEHAKNLLNYDYKFKEKCKQLANELNLTYEEYHQSILDYLRGEKVRLEGSTKEFIRELKKAAQIHRRLNLQYS
jgi:fatty-acid desaturase